MSLVLREELDAICRLSSCSRFCTKWLENRRTSVKPISYEIALRVGDEQARVERTAVEEQDV